MVSVFVQVQVKPTKPPKPARVKQTRDADTQVASVEPRMVKDTIHKWGTLPKGSSTKSNGAGNAGFVESFRRVKAAQPDVVPLEEPLPETDSDCE